VIAWRSFRPSGTIRRIDITCECMARVYVLCSAGGLRHINRVDRHESGSDTC